MTWVESTTKLEPVTTPPKGEPEMGIVGLQAKLAMTGLTAAVLLIVKVADRFDGPV